MANFATDIPGFRDALIAFALPPAPEGVSDEAWDAVGIKLGDAHMVVSPVVQMVHVFDALKPHAEHLDDDGLKVLASAAFLIHQGQFFGKGMEAFETLQSVTAQLDALAT